MKLFQQLRLILGLLPLVVDAINSPGSISVTRVEDNPADSKDCTVEVRGAMYYNEM
jgi:hypothetical protein